jgi:hypothetical protein
MTQATTARMILTEEEWAMRSGACYDAKAIVKSALGQIPSGGPKDGPFFLLRRVLDYLQKQATEAESHLL